MTLQLNFREDVDEPDFRAVFVEVILPLALANTFTYRLPSEFIHAVKKGQRVVVQFGKKKIYTALVVEVHHNPPKEYIAKYILDLLDEQPIVSELQLSFWKWISEYYCCTMGEVMDAAFPANMKMESETRFTLHPEAEKSIYELSDKEELIYAALRKEGILSVNQISDILGQKTVMPLVKSMYEKNYLLLKEEITDSYKPRMEVFVDHHFDPEDKEHQQGLFAQLESAPKQSDILLTYLQMYRKGPVMRRKLLKAANTSSQALNALVEKGIFSLYEDEVDRIQAAESKGWDYELNEEQQEALNHIHEEFKQKDVVLLHGVTGSGKTHIYMELIDEVIKEGKQALYLVPEIALTTQLIRRLQAKYGNDIGIYHSKFNANERVEIWNKVLNGTYKVVLGVRSAMFLPFRELGLLVIDEEHEHTFKQYEPAPRYHARDAGIYLMSLYGGKTILGTATPSFESYFNAKRGKYGLVKLLARWSEIKMPEILIADLREDLKKKQMKSHFSSLLFREMQHTLENKGQVILFQNRRGYAPIIECQTCGWTPACVNCDISLTYHQATREVVCHYCGYKEQNPKKCKACGNFALKMFGFGTEKIEDELHIFFPENQSLRMDQDTTRAKNSYAKIINALEDGEADILVGTQMVTKGLDFENVRLVGILNADQMLRQPDFRAIERAYQLMSQVSGRAGRRATQGKVVIQTYNMQHDVFRFLIKHDYDNFYEAHIDERLEFNYPPFYKLIKLVFKHEDIHVVKKAADTVAFDLRELFAHRVLGPEAPPISRIRNKYLMHIMLKFERRDLKMQEVKKEIMHVVEEFRANKDFRGVRLVVDVDPY